MKAFGRSWFSGSKKTGSSFLFYIIEYLFQQDWTTWKLKACRTKPVFLVIRRRRPTGAFLAGATLLILRKSTLYFHSPFGRRLLLRSRPIGGPPHVWLTRSIEVLSLEARKGVVTLTLSEDYHLQTNLLAALNHYCDIFSSYCCDNKELVPVLGCMPVLVLFNK